MDSKKNQKITVENSFLVCLFRGIIVGFIVALVVTSVSLVFKITNLEEDLNVQKNTLDKLSMRLEELENRDAKKSFSEKRLFGRNLLAAADSPCTCPPGPKGNQGERGERGRTGRTGKSGDPGELGRPGFDGVKGELGEKGENGDTGERGERGLEGSRGAKGEIGKTGPKGAKGPKGDRGIKGIQGPKGPYGSPGLKGNIGQPGPRGERGETGNYTLLDQKGNMISTGTLRAIHLHGTGGDNAKTGEKNLGGFGAVKSWKIATETGGFELKPDGNVTVLDSGQYYIYSKILFYDNKAFFSAETRINGVPYLKCSGQRAVAAQRFGSCTSNGIAKLQGGDEVGIKSVYPYSFVDNRNEASYFGLIKLN